VFLAMSKCDQTGIFIQGVTALVKYSFALFWPPF
jgi:hypothetical protein